MFCLISNVEEEIIYLEEKEVKMRAKDEDQESVSVKSYLVQMVHKLGHR